MGNDPLNLVPSPSPKRVRNFLYNSYNTQHWNATIAAANGHVFGKCEDIGRSDSVARGSPGREVENKWKFEMGRLEGRERRKESGEVGVKVWRGW